MSVENDVPPHPQHELAVNTVFIITLVRDLLWRINE